MFATCRPKRRHVLFSGRPAVAPIRAKRRSQTSVIAMNKSAASHLLPVFARVDLGFERGEGAWLIDQRRALSRFRLGRRRQRARPCHPHLVEALQEQAKSCGTSRTSSRARTASSSPRGCASRALPISCSSANSGAEAIEGAIKIARRYHAAKGHPERYRIITFEGAFHGRTLARSRRPARRNISKASGRRSTASTRCRMAISMR